MIIIKRQLSRVEVQEMLEAWTTRRGADVRAMDRLVRRYRTEGENMHWHIAGDRKGMGTLEVTYIPSTGKLTVLVHENRRGYWAGQAYADLAHDIEEHSR